MPTQAELIAQAKKQWDIANAANDKAGKAAAKLAADKARGYTTNASGTERVMSYQEALAQAKQSAEGMGISASRIDPEYVKSLQTGTGQAYTQKSVDTGMASRPQESTYQQQQALTPQISQTFMPQATPQTPTNVVDTNTLARQLADAQKQKQLSSLEQAYQKNLGMLNAEKSTVDPLYDAQNRRAVASSTMGKKSFSDFLAEKGLSSSGLAGQGELSQNIALQGELGGIQADRTGTLADIERRRTGYGEDLAYGRQQAETGADITALEHQMRQAEQGVVDRRTQEADVKNQFLDTITRFANDYQSQINKIRGDADPSNDWQIPYLETARQDKIASQKLDQYGRPLQQASAMTQTQAIARWKALGYADQVVADIMGVNVGDKPYEKPKSTSGSKSTVDYNKLIDQDL